MKLILSLLLLGCLCDQQPWWPDEDEEQPEWSEEHGMPWYEEGESTLDDAEPGVDPTEEE